MAKAKTKSAGKDLGRELALGVVGIDVRFPGAEDAAMELDATEWRAIVALARQVLDKGSRPCCWAGGAK